ncbi:hypothetical protein C942_00939 [Photobacterium marinum]|uniref:Uncharacterized protein n=1 Tax=Photobacterium marinum TaxID=1056511 RepID=L8JEL0_9GAMM|nr:hypothetical protein [Photobacterium marinum]ELR65852.1 hypothetical protein C942_00939 [Photobacterium marinum]
MEYSIDYQYLPRGRTRPIDSGEVVGIKLDDKSGVVVLPNVGDFVHIDNSLDIDGRESFSGKVKSKLFSYLRSSNGKVYCHVNIVVEDDEESNWESLIKE